MRGFRVSDFGWIQGLGLRMGSGSRVSDGFRVSGFGWVQGLGFQMGSGSRVSDVQPTP